MCGQNLASGPHRPPDTLYHYTSQRGLLGIIREESIQATNIKYLNDSTEFSYTIELASKFLEERGCDVESTPSEVISLLRTPETGPVFAASFSSQRNQLSQWRGYCPDSGGFMLGFDSSKIQILAKEQGFQLARCIYDIDEQLAIIEKEIGNPLKVSASKWSCENGNSCIDLDEIMKTNGKQRLDLALDLLNLAPKFKDPSFHEEEEWRLIAIAGPAWPREVKFREGKSMIVPYIEFKLTDKKKGMPLPIKEIMVGPTSHFDLSMLSVHQLLVDKHIGSCQVVTSKIPYRAW
jgi:hypothetical protein